MIAPALFALTTAPLFAAPVYSAALGARAELRMRTPGDPTPTGAVSDRSFDADFSGAAFVLASFRRLELGIGYLPRLTLADFTHETVRDVLHGAEATASWKASRRVVLGLRESASYGDRQFSPLTGPGVQPRPGPASSQAALDGSVAYFSSETLLSSALMLTRRSNLQLSASYFTGGGRDAASRQELPLTSGVRAAASWGYAVQRLDSLTTGVDATFQRTGARVDSPAVRSATFTASEGWHRKWSRSTDSDVVAGVGLAQTSFPNERWFLYPSTAATLLHRIVTGPEHGTLQLSGTVGIEGVVDQFTGEPDPRLRASARALQSIDPVTMYVEVMRVRSLRDTASELSLTSGEAGIRVQATEALSLDSGVRVIDQTLEQTPETPPLASEGLAWAVFVALELRFGPRPFRYLTR